MKTQINPSELGLIQQIRERAARAKGTVPLGIGDDCALLRFRSGEQAAVTTDLSIQDRHFRLDLHPAEAIGHRTLARGLSDIASMGGRPVAAFLSLGLPPELTRTSAKNRSAWVERFLDGFFRLADQNKIPLAGGDLAQSAIALADIVVIGAVPKGQASLRSKARKGDILYVTGQLGGSAAGLKQLLRGKLRQSSPSLVPHLWPQPRVAQGLWLRRHNAATAAIDVSDGLSTDLHHLCEASRVSAEIEASSLPVFGGATLEDALNGGEDYELLFTARPTTRIPSKIAGIPITRIGVISKERSASSRVSVMDASGSYPLEPRGWEHFRGAPGKP